MSRLAVVLSIVLVFASVALGQLCRDPPEPCTVNVTGSSFMRPQFQADDPNHEFKRCFDFLKTDFCVEWKAVESSNQEFMNVSIVISVDHVPVHTIQTTWPDLYKGDGVCLDDATIVEILLLIPSLQGSAKILQSILQVVGCLPSGLFSLCFQGTGDQSDHCLAMTYDLLYFENYCVLGGVVDIGCDH